MHWDSVRPGLLDELSKIADIDLSGLSPQTVLESGRHAPPMETEGYAKALQIIDRAKLIELKQTELPKTAGSFGDRIGEGLAMGGLMAGGTYVVNKAFRKKTPMSKTSAPSIPFNPDLPQVNRLSGAKRGKKQPDLVDRGKSLGAHAAGGLGVGRLVGELSVLPGKAKSLGSHGLHARRWYGSAIGAGVGAGEFVRKRIVEARRRKMETKTAGVSAVLSPGKALQASRQVAKTVGKPRTSGPTLKGQLRGSVLGRKFLPGA